MKYFIYNSLNECDVITLFLQPEVMFILINKKFLDLIEVEKIMFEK